MQYPNPVRSSDFALLTDNGACRPEAPPALVENCVEKLFGTATRNAPVRSNEKVRAKGSFGPLQY